MEDFVTYEQAVKLKELGFNWKCFGFYNHYKIPSIEHYIWDEGKIIKENYNDDFIANTYNVLCSAPTLAQAQKWLRETKNIIIEIYCVKCIFDPLVWNFSIVDSNNKELIEPDYENPCDTYEKALSAGIDKALQILSGKTEKK